jgi:hypothetical protein
LVSDIEGERTLRVFDDRVLSRIFGPKRHEVTGNGDYITRSLMICTHHQYYSGDRIEKTEMGGACSTYTGEERSYRILVGRPEGRSHLEDPGLDERIILKWMFRKWHGAWTGLI